MTVRRYLAFGAVLAIVAAACGGAAAPSSPAASAVLPSGGAASPSGVPASASAAPLEPADIVYWTHENQPRNTLDKELIAEFMAANPGVNVTYETFPYEDYETKVLTALAGATGPQLFNLFTSRMGDLATSKAIVPLDYAALGVGSQQAFRDLYVDGTLAGYEFGGSLYGVPTEVSNMALFVNTAALQDAGLDPQADLPKTWEDVVAVSQKIVKRQGNRLVQRGFEFSYGGDIDIPVLGYESMAYQLGGGVVAADGKTVTIDQPPAVRALQFWYDWVNTNKLGDPSLGETTQAFCDGTVAMTTVAQWFGSWLDENCPDLKGKVTVVPFPRFAQSVNNTGALLFAYGHVVNAAATPAQQRAAWKLASFLASRPADFLQRAGLVQPRKELLTSPAIDSAPFARLFVTEMQGAPFDQLSFETWQAVQRAIERSTTSKVAPAESLAEAKRDIAAILAK